MLAFRNCCFYVKILLIVGLVWNGFLTTAQPEPFGAEAAQPEQDSTKASPTKAFGPVEAQPKALGPNRELIEADSDPFWKKPKYYEKLKERSILVSVVTVDHEGAKKHKKLKMTGAGIVNRPVKTSYETLKQFEKWPKMSAFIQGATFNEEDQILKLHLEAFNYHAHLNMRVFFDDSEPNPRALRFLVLEGAFEGMKGLLEFKDFKRRKTEISMTVIDEFDKLPLPDFFLEFGLEVVFQKIAERMRGFIESSHLKQESSK